jgi:glycosyltransferase involved in cell wall biosynthesis
MSTCESSPPPWPARGSRAMSSPGPGRPISPPPVERGARAAGAPHPRRAAHRAAQGARCRRSSIVHGKGCWTHGLAGRFDLGPVTTSCPSPRCTPTTGSRGSPAHVIKHELNLPLVCTFHTLDRVKAESMPEEVEADMPHRRAEAEASIIDCSDAVLASCTVEAEQIASLYGATRRASASSRLGSTMPFSVPAIARRPAAPWDFPSSGRLLLFVGRIQPLKCADAAIETLAELSTARRRALPPGRGRRPERPHGEKSLQGLSTWPTPAACGPRPLRGTPSRTSSCPPITGRPTSASCPAAPSRSGWSPSRRPPAAPRSSPRPSAG